MSQRGAIDTQNKPGRGAATIALGYWLEDPPGTYVPVTLLSSATHVLNFDPVLDTYTMTPIDEADNPARTYVRAGSLVIQAP